MSETKTKRIKALKEFIELETLHKEPVQEYIDWAKEEIAKLEAYLKKEHQRVTNFLILTSMNRKKRETAYENRKLIKAGNRESCRQRKIRLNRERRQALKSA
jgi:hypothetical protein